MSITQIGATLHALLGSWARDVQRTNLHCWWVFVIGWFMVEFWIPFCSFPCIIVRDILYSSSIWACVCFRYMGFFKARIVILMIFFPLSEIFFVHTKTLFISLTFHDDVT